MAANIFARYVWLVDVIRRYGRISYNDINRLWMRSGLNDGSGLSRRMFQRHRNQIEEIFDIAIDCENTPPYRYYIANEENLNSDGLRSWIIDTFAVDNLLRNNAKLRKRVSLENIPYNGKRYLTNIAEAMEDGKAVEIGYSTEYAPSVYKAVVEPYCLKMYRQRWYLVGRSADMVKIYALDRITECQAIEQKFSLPEGFSAEKYFADCFGIIKDKEVKPQLIRLKFSDEQAKYIRSLPIHPSQCEVERNVFEVRLCPTFDFMQFLFSQLDTVEVLAPQSLRKEVASIAKRIRDKNISEV